MRASTTARVVRVLSVLWPAFMVSIVLEGLLFTLFEPVAMRWSDSLGDPLSPGGGVQPGLSGDLGPACPWPWPWRAPSNRRQPLPPKGRAPRPDRFAGLMPCPCGHPKPVLPVDACVAKRAPSA